MNRIGKLVVNFGCVVIPLAALYAKINISEAPPPSSPVLIAFGNSQSYRGINLPSPDCGVIFGTALGQALLIAP